MIIPGASGNRETLCRRMLPAGGRDGAGNRGFGRGFMGGEGRKAGRPLGREGGEEQERRVRECLLTAKQEFGRGRVEDFLEALFFVWVYVESDGSNNL